MIGMQQISTADSRLAEGASPRLLRLLLADMHRRDADFLKGSHDSLIVDAGAYRRGK